MQKVLLDYLPDPRENEPVDLFTVVDRSTKLLLIALFVALTVPLTLAIIVFADVMEATELIAQALLLTAMLPLIVMSVYMWATGRGAMLIAGFNTSPKAVQDSYDSAALARFVGMVLTIFMFILLMGLEALVLFDAAIPFWILLIVSLTILSASVVYMNTGKRFLRDGARPPSALITAADRKRNRRLMIAVLAVIAIVLVAAFFFIGSGSVAASLDADSLHVSAPMVNENVGYHSITSVELRHGFDDGRRVNGFGGTQVNSGSFENEEFGHYVLARYNGVDACIVVHRSGGVLAFNLQTAEETERLYGELLTKL
ncbi:MAG: DUF3784 domain-containing protein [Methanomassiliicoccus sp.]|nr:DUF3784 domain-containing protein [Methanomassiliicoccus sp.]